LKNTTLVVFLIKHLGCATGAVEESLTRTAHGSEMPTSWSNVCALSGLPKTVQLQ